MKRINRIGFEPVGMCRACHQWVGLNSRGTLVTHEWRGWHCSGSAYVPMQRDRCSLKDAPDARPD